MPDQFKSKWLKIEKLLDTFNKDDSYIHKLNETKNKNIQEYQFMINSMTELQQKQWRIIETLCTKFTMYVDEVYLAELIASKYNSQYPMKLT